MRGSRRNTIKQYKDPTTKILMSVVFGIMLLGVVAFFAIPEAKAQDGYGPDIQGQGPVPTQVMKFLLKKYDRQSNKFDGPATIVTNGEVHNKVGYYILVGDGSIAFLGTNGRVIVTSNYTIKFDEKIGK